MSTDRDMSDEDIAQVFSVRWSEEVMHRNVKQFLGLSDPQNGWWRRRAPWYRHKTHPSFGDMLAAARSQLATNPVFVEPGSRPHSTKTQRALLDLMMAP